MPARRCDSVALSPQPFWSVRAARVDTSPGGKPLWMGAFCDHYLVLVIHGVGDQYADNNFITSLERCTEALARLIERQSKRIREQLRSTSQARGCFADALLENWPSVDVRCIEWHSKLQYKHGWNHMVERVTPAGIEEVRRIMRETFGDIALFMSPKWHQVIMEEVVHELTLAYERKREQVRQAVSLDGAVPSVRVALLCHSLGALIGFDLIRLGYALPFQVEHVFLCGSPLGAYLSLLPNGEQLARKYLLDLWIERQRDEDVVGKATPAERFASNTQMRLRSGRADRTGIRHTREHVDGYAASSRNAAAAGATLQPRFYNLFHPLDPAAFRLEPWLDPSMALQESVELPLPLELERLLSSRAPAQVPAAPRMQTAATAFTTTNAMTASTATNAATLPKGIDACPEQQPPRYAPCAASALSVEGPAASAGDDMSASSIPDDVDAQSTGSFSSAEVLTRASSTRRSLSSPRLSQLGGEGTYRDDPFATTGLGAALRGRTAVGLSRSSSNPEFTVPLTAAETDLPAKDSVPAESLDPDRMGCTCGEAHSLDRKRLQCAIRTCTRRGAKTGRSEQAKQVELPGTQFPDSVKDWCRPYREPEFSLDDTRVYKRPHGNPEVGCYFRRVDYVVHDPQVARSGRVWQFVQCLRSHACYWTSDEVASFVVGILYDCLRQPRARLNEMGALMGTDLGSMASAQRFGNGHARFCTDAVPDAVASLADGRDANAPAANRETDTSAPSGNGMLARGRASPARRSASSASLDPAQRKPECCQQCIPGASTAAFTSVGRPGELLTVSTKNSVRSRNGAGHRASVSPTNSAYAKHGSPDPDENHDHHTGQFRLLHEVSSLSPAPTVGFLVGDSAPRPLRMISDLLEKLVTEGRWVAALMLVSGAFIMSCGLVALILALLVRSLYVTLFLKQKHPLGFLS